MIQIQELWSSLMELLPKIAGAIVVLIVGWIAGRALGKGVSILLGKIGVGDAFRKTLVGRALERSGVTSIRFFDLVVRWFVYLIAIFVAVDILKIRILSAFMTEVVSYLPSFIYGLVILFVGLMFGDFVGDAVKAIGREAKIEFIGLLAEGLRLFLYFIVVVIALAVMKIDVSILHTFANALAWGVAIGVCVGLGIAFGWGFKDVVAKNAEKWLESTKTVAKKAEDFWSWYSRKQIGEGKSEEA